MGKEIFRKKSLDRISSPESLDEYLKVASPSVWLILVAVIVMLVGVCFWGIFGSMESTDMTPVVSDGKDTYCYVLEDYYSTALEGRQIRINGKIYTMGDVPHFPIELTGETEEGSYVLHMMGDEAGSVWVYKVRLNWSLPEGSYDGWIINKRIHPFKYVMQ